MKGQIKNLVGLVDDLTTASLAVGDAIEDLKSSDYKREFIAMPDEDESDVDDLLSSAMLRLEGVEERVGIIIKEVQKMSLPQKLQFGGKTVSIVVHVTKKSNGIRGVGSFFFQTSIQLWTCHTISYPI